MGGDGHHAWIAGEGNGKIIVAQVNEAGGGSPDGMQAWASFDNGLTFQQVGPILTTPDVAGTFTGNNNSGIYHRNSDTLIISTHTGGTAPRIWALSPVSNDGVWRDLTFDLPSYGAYWDQLGVIP